MYCDQFFLVVFVFFFFFKQKTAYEMRISDWSSDVCSSDLVGPDRAAAAWLRGPGPRAQLGPPRALSAALRRRQHAGGELQHPGQLLPHPAPADAPQVPQAADPDDAEVAAASQAGGVQAAGDGDRKSPRMNCSH